jgi:hypothetical protein
MEDRWLNRIVFWIMVPIPLGILVMLTPLYGPFWFTAGLLVYAMIYRPILNIFRLLKLKVIEEKDAWKMFIPFYDTRYLKSLFLG